MSVRARAVSALPVVAGIAGLLLPIVTLLGIGLALQVAPWFSWTVNALSDLGMVPASAILFNGAMIAGGVLLFIFSYGIRSRVSRPAGLLIRFASVMLVGVGIVSESFFVVHWMFSCAFFISIVSCFLVLWFTVSHNQKKMAKVSRALVILAVVSSGLFWFFPGAAVPESCVLIPAFLWCAGVGVLVLILPEAQKKTRKVKTPAMTG